MNIPYITLALQNNEAMLLKHATRLTKDINTAYDLYQETAYRALKHAGKFTADTNEQAWLMTIMRNLFINDYRKKKRRQTLQDGSNNNYLLNNGDAEVYNDGESQVDYQALLRMIDQLEDNLRIPFLLNYEGYKYEEIAAQLDIPLGTVKSRIFFARKRMRSAVKAHYAIRYGCPKYKFKSSPHICSDQKAKTCKEQLNMSVSYYTGERKPRREAKKMEH